MPSPSSDPLAKRHCKPCEGDVEKLSLAQSQSLLTHLPHWHLDDAGDAIFRKWKLRDFAAAMTLLSRVAEIAEDQQHHPDLHLTGYRHVRIVLSTHAIGGLSENDFILAAKIDEIAAQA